MGWRDDATQLLKKALVGATEPKEIREISSAISSLQPYPEAVGGERPMPVRVVAGPRKGKGRKKKVWRKG